jgi:hypothetical protein
MSDVQHLAERAARAQKININTAPKDVLKPLF